MGRPRAVIFDFNGTLSDDEWLGLDHPDVGEVIAERIARYRAEIEPVVRAAGLDHLRRLLGE